MKYSLSLGIDTSNYATSIAVIDIEKNAVAFSAKKMLPVPKGALGLRQSETVFHHTLFLPDLLLGIQREGADLTKISVVGVSEKPRPLEKSYMPCFLSGVAFATSFSLGANVKLYRTTHQQGHIAAALFGSGQRPIETGKRLVFHVSGGTTDLMLCEGYSINSYLGTSNDLYAGQIVDRLGVRFGFAFPAGAKLSELAMECQEMIVPKISMREGNCNLSGLENQCDSLLQKGQTPSYVAKYCLSAIAAVAIAMAQEARIKYPALPLICAGGVMSSFLIQRIMKSVLHDVFFAPQHYSSDNAVGTALIAACEAKNG